MRNYNDINEYINSAPNDIKVKLNKLYKLIKTTVPETDDAISYGMPTFKLNGKNLVHFAYYKNHIGFYPTPSPIEKFKNKLKDYKYSKGAIQFPLSEDLPLNLIKEIVVERIKELENKK